MSRFQDMNRGQESSSASSSNSVSNIAYNNRNEYQVQNCEINLMLSQFFKKRQKVCEIEIFNEI